MGDLPTLPTVRAPIHGALYDMPSYAASRVHIYFTAPLCPHKGARQRTSDEQERRRT